MTGSRACPPAVLVLAGLLPACRTDQTFITPDPHLNRMLVQEKVTAYSDNPVLPRGMAMQQPPDGTLPVDTSLGPPAVSTGVAADRYVDHIPIRVDRRLVEDGRRNFDTFCAPCHGVLGDGASVVAEKMTLRKPRNLNDAEVRAYADGRIYQTIREGYGLMPSYAVQLSIQDSWGVVAYVRALQAARGVRVAELPPDVRRDLERLAP